MAAILLSINRETQLVAVAVQQFVNWSELNAPGNEWKPFYEFQMVCVCVLCECFFSFICSCKRDFKHGIKCREEKRHSRNQNDLSLFQHVACIFFLSSLCAKKSLLLWVRALAFGSVLDMSLHVSVAKNNSRVREEKNRFAIAKIESLA